VIVSSVGRRAILLASARWREAAHVVLQEVAVLRVVGEAVDQMEDRARFATTATSPAICRVTAPRSEWLAHLARAAAAAVAAPATSAARRDICRVIAPTGPRGVVDVVRMTASAITAGREVTCHVTAPRSRPVALGVAAAAAAEVRSATSVERLITFSATARRIPEASVEVIQAACAATTATRWGTSPETAQSKLRHDPTLDAGCIVSCPTLSRS